MADDPTTTAAGPPRSPAEAVALGKRLADEGHAVGWQPATACEWCGRAVKQDAEGRWYAVKGKERGYDPLACDASDDGHHAPD